MMECQERNCGTLLYEEVRGDRSTVVEGGADLLNDILVRCAFHDKIV